jgi:hypothetical protein
MKNLGTSDRLVRVIIAEACVIAAFFWVKEDLQLLLVLAAIVMMIPVITGSCGLYEMLGWNSCEIVKRKDKNIKKAFMVVALLLAVMGSFASAVLTNNIFLEDLENVDEAYSLALQATVQGETGNATMQQEKLESAFAAFQDKYSRYKPLTVKYDGNFTSQMNNISLAIAGSRQDILHGNLTSAHEEMKKIGPIIEKMQDR